MSVTLRPIGQDNWIECVHLDVSDEQRARGFVSPNVFSLAQAYAEPWWNPLGIYAGDTLVGFVMYGRRPPDTAVNYILRMMVDARYQGRRYGTAALALVIERIREQDGGEIQLDYDEDNTAAARLYAGAGFRPIHVNEHGEVLAGLS